MQKNVKKPLTISDVRKVVYEIVDEKISSLKSDLLTRLDEVMGELKIIREEQTILSSQHGRILDLEDKVENLEKIHPAGKHISI